MIPYIHLSRLFLSLQPYLVCHEHHGVCTLYLYCTQSDKAPVEVVCIDVSAIKHTDRKSVV